LHAPASFHAPAPYCSC